jgi:transcription antitermination factor NusG
MDGGARILDFPTKSRWYVAQTEDGSHSTMAEAFERLGGAGFHSFYPTYRKRRWAKGRTRPVMTLPLFPRFLFVELDLNLPGWGEAARIDGIAGFLPRRHERPVPLPVGAIEELQTNQLARDADFERVVRAKPIRFAPGQTVQVTSRSLWFGMAGTVLVSSAERVRVLLSLFGRECEADLPVSEVEAA